MNFNLLENNSNLFGKYLRQMSNLLGNPQDGFEMMFEVGRNTLGPLSVI